MRLVCPNCDAEYEVDASVIPDGGRDVQCSNCGHAWFQNSPALEAEIAAEEALYEAPPARVTPPAPPEPAPEQSPAPAPMESQTIDASVLAVLTEEAELELAARRSEAPAMEMQTDMALEAPAAEAGGLGAVARRLARMKGGEPAKVATRADAFPEIEEINSTLRASSEKRSGTAAVIADGALEKSAGRGFRSGFMLMMILAVLIVAIYVMAPKLAEQFPAATGLKSYVNFIDAARLMLDSMLKSASAFLRGFSGNQA